MRKNTTILLVGVSMCFFTCQSPPNQDLVLGKSSVSDKDTISVSDLPDSIFVKIDLVDLQIINQMVYATDQNFTHQIIYPCAACYLRNEVAYSLIKVQALAMKQKLRLIVFDCYRPLKYQQKMFDLVQDPNYVANPQKGSKHNRGTAVDVGLADMDGHALDMGTEFDDFTDKSHYQAEGLTTEQIKNRKILRDLMLAAQFEPYEKEWWHFNHANSIFPLSNFQWECQ